LGWWILRGKVHIGEADSVVAREAGCGYAGEIGKHVVGVVLSRTNFEIEKKPDKKSGNPLFCRVSFKEN
jgi:hypothetical protein